MVYLPHSGPRPSRPLVVLDCVGLTPAHIGADTPHLARLAAEGFLTPLAPALPAVTTTGQVTMLTGVNPSEHGVVANGWYFRELNEILLWRQSETLVQAPHVWEGMPWKVLKHFWWYAMNTSTEATVTPRPAYHHDGAKSPDFYAYPPRLKALLEEKHGTFPLFHFWGPTANAQSTRWIADSFCTAWDSVAPDLGLCYLPHLDYDLQRFGPTGPHLAPNLRELDACAGRVIDHALARNARILVVSEYGISPVSDAIFPNRALREAGLLEVSTNATGELLDTGASRAFAVCDHQLAHVYVRHPSDVAATRHCLERLPGVERVFGPQERGALGLDHTRSGELIVLAAQGLWFAFDYWLDSALKPDFAHSVEIHKKPGYDPRELFFDPNGGKLRAAKALLKKKLGLRYILDPCSLDPTLVKGSHGLAPLRPEDGALLLSSERSVEALAPKHHRDVAAVIRHCLQYGRG
ncbi:MAG: nucleotide pyrophosphatase/phosphodiesterase family protein [Verrucomicrobiota bacterium]